MTTFVYTNIQVLFERALVRSCYFKEPFYTNGFFYA